MGSFASQDLKMISTYNEGKDLYALIASMAFDMPYEQCLEFYPPNTKIMFEGEEVITGDDKEHPVEYDENIQGFTLPYYRSVNTVNGFIPATELNIGDSILTDEGEKTIINILTEDSNITLIIK